MRLMIISIQLHIPVMQYIYRTPGNWGSKLSCNVGFVENFLNFLETVLQNINNEFGFDMNTHPEYHLQS